MVKYLLILGLCLLLNLWISVVHGYRTILFLMILFYYYILFGCIINGVYLSSNYFFYYGTSLREETDETMTQTCTHQIRLLEVLIYGATLASALAFWLAFLTSAFLSSV